MFPGRVRPSRPVIIASVTVAALLGGTGVALAVTSSPSSGLGKAARLLTAAGKPSQSRCQVKFPGPGLPLPRRAFAIAGPPGAFAFGPIAFGPLGLGPLGAVHGQFVVPKAHGGYQTVDTQRGTVTAVSASSITVKSADGYIKTYQVTSSTKVDAQRAGIGSVKNGQTVSVVATVNGSSATASEIVDFVALPKQLKMPEILKPGSRHVFRIGPCIKASISSS